MRTLLRYLILSFPLSAGLAGTLYAADTPVSTPPTLAPTPAVMVSKPAPSPTTEPAPLVTAATPGAAPGMVITADSMEHDNTTKQITAIGRVIMTWQDMTMNAERAVYNPETKIMTATGNVFLVKGPDAMWGDRLVMDTDSGRSEMENGRVFMTKGNFRADGNPVIKQDDDSYTLKDGSFTTCDADDPAWHFSAPRFDVTVEEYGTGRHVLFYVKDIPVFYFPYLIFPAKRERQSGLLFPKFGSSGKKGFFLNQPYYWAISPSQEATFNLDFQSRRGTGLGVNYQYRLSRNSEGSLAAYAINDRIEGKARGELVQFHREQLPDNLTFIASMNLVSDQTFLADYGETNGTYNRQYNDSRIVLTKSWDNWLTTAQTIYTQDFSTGTNDTTLQRLPEVALYGVNTPLAPKQNLFGDVDLLLTSYYRTKGMDGQRLLAEPIVKTRESFFGGRLVASGYIGAQMHGYRVSGATDPSTKENAAIIIPEGGVQVVTSLSKVYDTPLLGFDRFRNEVVPRLRYDIVATRNQADYPLFDQTDRYQGHKTLTASLDSALDGKVVQDGKSEYFDLLYVRLIQSYLFSGAPSSLLTLTDTDTTTQAGHLGELILETSSYLTRDLRLLLDARYDHSTATISSSSTGLEYNDKQGTTARLSYRNVTDRVDYLEAGMTTSLTKPFFLGYATRRSVDGGTELESTYSAEYRHQCWSLIAGYTKRPNEHTFTVMINLGGLFSLPVPTAFR